MSSQDGTQSPVYRPTSLDFINRPNPVEPHAVPEKHPLYGTARPEQTPNQDLLRRILDPNPNACSDRTSAPRKSTDGPLLDLPALPVRSGNTRLRIPPTLSGLHHPPPNAGLLPRISVNKPRDVIEEPKHSEPNQPSESEAATPSPPAGTSTEASRPTRKFVRKHRRHLWSEQETACLLKGVARFGIGNWTKILNCADYHFERRTALDLKDRFRTCCPDDYKSIRKSQVEKPVDQDQASSQPSPKSSPKESTSLSPKASPKVVKTARKSSVELRALGIEEPFAKSKRRKRTIYALEEDQALLKGFRRHGNSWAAILQDPELAVYFQNRTSTDIRDRVRSKYPEDYKKTGLAPRPRTTNKRHSRDDGDENGAQGLDGATRPRSPASKSRREVGPETKEQPATPTRKQPLAAILAPADVFWGAPLDNEEAESERITLDRRILDWPAGGGGRSSGHADGPRSGVDLPVTPNAWRPATTNSVSQPSSTGHTVGNTNNAAALPSLATITANGWNAEYDDDQLELPSLMSAFNSLDGDGRGCGPPLIGFYDL